MTILSTRMYHSALLCIFNETIEQFMYRYLLRFKFNTENHGNLIADVYPIENGNNARCVH